MEVFYEKWMGKVKSHRSNCNFSFNDGKMSLSLKVLLKEYSSKGTYFFFYLLKDGTTDSIKAYVNDGNYLVADIDVPFREGIKINYIEA